MNLDQFVQEYVTQLKAEERDLKEALIRLDDFPTIRHYQGRIEGLRSALRFLEVTLENEQRSEASR